MSLFKTVPHRKETNPTKNNQLKLKDDESDLEFDKLFTLTLTLKVIKYDASIMYNLQVKGRFKFLEEGKINAIVILIFFLL